MLNHRRFVAIAILAAISLALPGYVLAQNYPPSVGQLAASTKKRVKTINCKTGGRCALAAKTLQELGFINVAAADMKHEDWVKAGEPLVK